MPTRRPLDEATAEALLAGRSVTAGEDALLAAFISDLRMAAQGPPPTPSPALASVLDGGLATDKGDLPVTAASNVPGPAPQAAGLPKWRRRKMIIASLLGGLSLPAKALIGVSMAATSIGGAAAAGVPAAQKAVEAVSPVEFHPNAEHGENVSTTARETTATGREKGEAVSDVARTKGEEMRQDGDHSSGAPAAPGSTGLGTASQTPAGAHAPTAVPATPAAGADNAPADTPAGPPAETPASSAPVDTPAGPPSGAQVTDAPPSSTPVDTPAGPPSGTPRP